jgi:hypothetical protein
MLPLKKLSKRLAPRLFYAVKRGRRKRAFRMGHGGAEYRVKRVLVERYGRQVQMGPFAGMRYGDDVVCSAYLAKLVGSYEEELHDVIRQVILRRYEAVLDVGCAEGYYAVGLAVRIPTARVYAYDTDDEARWYCNGLARMNGVAGRVTVRGACDHQELENLCSRDALVICDCEGFEDELLDPDRAPSLLHADIIVELHEFIRPGVTAKVLNRFAASHSVRLFDTRSRDVENYPLLKAVAEEDRPWAVREGRPAAMQWAYLISKTDGSVTPGAS